MDPTLRLPQTAAEFATPRPGAPATRPAATVVLLRDGAEGLEVHLQRRPPTMAFAAGRAVFPGGGVDPTDSQAPARWTGPSPAEWAEALDADEVRAGAIVVAAVRETFEECGVLLASADGASPDLTAPEWQAARRALAAHEISLGDLLDEYGLTLRSDLLRPWAVWVTPEFEKKRFHTWFLAARLPDGQEATGGTSESVKEEWIGVTAAIRSADAGELPLMPPQYCTMLELYGAASTDELFDAPRDVLTVRPRVAIDDEGPYLQLPDDLVELGRRVGAAMYPQTL
ncbi:NUDIX domain-containing protein [Tsukamurella sp. 8F]|uniref:NUDIX hydrolase n=1 Tax=unclassified Tsukamurella TaxID=2633480 RepID=UPI0023B8BBC2|nr:MULTISPECIES: NUDIX domain-containing protein [unclassified Tsukamurella]MDF0529439.1 NUDIX domain-containing protein [Tsukamurella sp. 8J]MDF0589348.1 NUDIX domain-containing protein [Tsukamurella sp. 8F]